MGGRTGCDRLGIAGATQPEVAAILGQSHGEVILGQRNDGARALEVALAGPQRMVAIKGGDARFAHDVGFVHHVPIVPPCANHARQGVAAFVIDVEAAIGAPIVLVHPHVVGILGRPEDHQLAAALWILGIGEDDEPPPPPPG